MHTRARTQNRLVSLFYSAFTHNRILTHRRNQLKLDIHNAMNEKEKERERFRDRLLSDNCANSSITVHKINNNGNGYSVYFGSRLRAQRKLYAWIYANQCAEHSNFFLFRFFFFSKKVFLYFMENVSNFSAFDLFCFVEVFLYFIFVACFKIKKRTSIEFESETFLFCFAELTINATQ